MECLIWPHWSFFSSIVALSGLALEATLGMKPETMVVRWISAGSRSGGANPIAQLYLLRVTVVCGSRLEARSPHAAAAKQTEPARVRPNAAMPILRPSVPASDRVW